MSMTPMSSSTSPVPEMESCSAVSYGARFVVADYLVCAATLLVSAVIGVYFAWKARGQKASTSEVLMGGRTMGTWPTALSLLASFMSAVTLLGNPAEMYRYGTQFVLIGVAYIVLTPLTAFVFVPVYHGLGLTSAYEYLALRFNNTVRLTGSIIFSLQMLMYMPIVIYAPALALNQVTGIDTTIAVTATTCVCIFYTSIGGMKAVMWADSFQVLLMFGGMLAVVARGTADLGGFGYVWDRAEESNRLEFFNLDADPRTRHTFWTLTVGGTFMWACTYAANQAQIQRYLSVSTVREAQRALYINCVGLVTLLLICCWGGLVMYAKYFECDPLLSKKIQASDQLLPLFVMETMADLPGIPGLFVAGIFSGALSTVSTGLSALAAIALTDLAPGCFGLKLEDSRAAKLSKWACLVFGLVCFGLVFIVAQVGAVLQAAYSVFGMVGGPILGVFSLGMLVPWANHKGALVGTLMSIALVLWMGVGAQVATAYGQLRTEQRPTSVLGCNCTAEVPPLPPLAEPDALTPWYGVSYMWYGPIAWILVMGVGTIVSFLTGPQDPRQLDRALLSPVTVSVLNSLPVTWQRALRWSSDPGEATKLENMSKEANMGQVNPVFTMWPNAV